ncbi:MAG: HDIG domain-containing protein [Deinococcus-Thermus bacterium]|jgi:putative nucleotidyltransferase with HDIG domain|nr:HDIG domain-containing protein [Deinococcota bacterium]
MSQEGTLRERAYELMTEWTPSEALQRHMLAVEAAVVAYAREEDADEDLWAATALLHDFDYERHPEPSEDGHPYVGVRHLREHGWPEELCEAILGHADYTGVPRTSRLAKVLYACDEITGLVTAAVLVRPDKDIAHQTVKSLKKKFKDKAFARGVHRDEVRRGAEELGVELWEHVGFVLAAMQERADALALDGRLA